MFLKSEPNIRMVYTWCPVYVIKNKGGRVRLQGKSMSEG